MGVIDQLSKAVAELIKKLNKAVPTIKRITIVIFLWGEDNSSNKNFGNKTKINGDIAKKTTESAKNQIVVLSIWYNFLKASLMFWNSVLFVSFKFFSCSYIIPLKWL